MIKSYSKSLLTILLIFTNCFSFSHQLPRISIITSVYNGDQFIKSFLEDITKQTTFDECELIIINANSPGNEEPVIREFMNSYPNIIYEKLNYDPGIYGVWNIAIKMAKASYITNANLDDRLKYDCYETHALYLDENPEVDLVYSACYMSYTPNETFDEYEKKEEKEILWHSNQDFSRIKLLYGYNPAHITHPMSLPNNHPMWRKLIHKFYGLFNEEYKSAGDLDMWIRAAVLGNATFQRIEGVYALCYKNINTLSGGEIDRKEREKICKIYPYLYENFFKNLSYLSDNL